jgi:hypothetical protein
MEKQGQSAGQPGIAKRKDAGFTGILAKILWARQGPDQSFKPGTASKSIRQTYDSKFFVYAICNAWALLFTWSFW